MPHLYWSKNNIFISIFVLFQPQNAPCDPGRAWSSIQQRANSDQNYLQGTSLTPSCKNFTNIIKTLSFNSFILVCGSCSLPFRPSLTHTTTPKTSTMTSPFWSCHPQCRWTPVCLLCAWPPAPLTSHLELNVSPLVGAGLAQLVSNQLPLHRCTDPVINIPLM